MSYSLDYFNTKSKREREREREREKLEIGRRKKDHSKQIKLSKVYFGVKRKQSSNNTKITGGTKAFLLKVT